MPTDYKVAPLYALDLCRIAARARSISSNRKEPIRLDELLINISNSGLPNKPKLKIEIRRTDPNGPIAFVRHLKEETVLVFDDKLWEKLKQNDVYARHVAAHEIAHIALHSCHDLPYSGNMAEFIKNFGPEHSAEEQAEDFAAALLIPTEAFQKFDNEFDLKSYYHVDDELYRRRLELFRKMDKIKYYAWLEMSLGLRF